MSYSAPPPFSAAEGHSQTSAPPPGAVLDTPLTRDFPATAQLSRQELEQLLYGDPLHAAYTASESGAASLADGSDAYFEAFVNRLPQVQHMLNQHEALLESIEQKAKRNAEVQPELEALRRETQAYFNEARDLDAQWAALNASLQELYKRFSPASLHAQLTHGTSKLHDASEALANAYAEGLPLPLSDDASSGAAGRAGGDTDAQFIRTFKELRTRYHRRSLLAERWAKGSVTWRDE